VEERYTNDRVQLIKAFNLKNEADRDDLRDRYRTATNKIDEVIPNSLHWKGLALEKIAD
jgi:hypothetical protein